MEQGRHDQLAITTHADAMRALEGCRLETNEEGCASLLQNMLRYVCNSVAAAEAGLSSDRMFHDRLISWIQTTLPSLREAGASDYLVPLEAAVKKPRLTNGGQLQNPTPQDAHESPPASAGTAALPVARALNFTEFQHLPDRCEQCANPCNTAKYQGLRCACGAIVCSDCHGLTIKATKQLANSSTFTFRCDACREQLGGEAVVVRESSRNRTCFACRNLLTDASSSNHAQCPKCRRRFCQRCACFALREVSASQRGLLRLTCPTCDGKYEEGRGKIVDSLFKAVLGNGWEHVQASTLTRQSLLGTKAHADQLGDLIYDLYSAGHREVSERHLARFLELVAAQMQHDIPASADPFHLLYYNGQSPLANTYMLAKLCRAQSKEALAKCRALLTPTSETLSPLRERPKVLKIGVYGSDLLQNSPTADLLFSSIECMCKGAAFEIFAFAVGPVDKKHPPAADIAKLCAGRLTLFSADMSAAEKLAKYRDAGLHALITLTGWTYGHDAEVFAALGSGPSPIPVINWLGWGGGLMCMREAVHYTIVGRMALSPRQRREAEGMRERTAQMSCYQPCQGHPSHRTGRALTRSDFNLPSSDVSFIYCYPSTTNRVTKDVFFLWLKIVSRVEHSILLVLHRPMTMRRTIRRWTLEFINAVDSSFDHNRVVLRPMQSKPYYWGLLRVVGERGACLDSVLPLGPHTGASDAVMNYVPVLSYQSENGMQARVALEVLAELGMLDECAAKDRDSFVEHAVKFGRNRPLQLALRSFMMRCDEEGINLYDRSRVASAVLRIVEEACKSFAAAGGDWEKLVDIDVCDSQTAVKLFKDSPEAAALGAVSVSEEDRSQTEKREKLLAQMLEKGLNSDMADNALQVMKAHQERGLILNSIVGDGGFSIAISATAERSINSDVSAGTQLALKISKEGWPVRHLKNSSLGREGIVTGLLEERLHNQEFADIIPRPVYVWSEKGRGRCFFGHTAPKPQDKSQKVLVFLCTELLTRNVRDELPQFGAEWRRTGDISSRMQEEILRPWFRTMHELHNTAVAAMMDVKPANFAVRENGRFVLIDLGALILFEKPTGHAAPVPAALSRNITRAWSADAPAAGQSVQANPVRGRVLTGSKACGLSFITNLQAASFCRTAAEQGKGFGRISHGTFGYADQAAIELRGKQITPREGYQGDMFSCGRSLLKGFVKTQTAGDFERSALEGAKHGLEGIRRLLLGSVASDVVVAQTIPLDCFCSLLAGLLNPDPEARLDALGAMIHGACTNPVHPPQDYIALFGGPGEEMPGGPSEGGPPGIEMPGGPLERLPAPIRDHPTLKRDLVGKELPPVLLLLQSGMGVGVRIRRAVRRGAPVCMYGGEYRAFLAAGSMYPTRFGVTVRAADGIKEHDAFVCDAGPSKERNFQWFKDTNNAGPFMNGFDENRHEVNCVLDRHTAWRSGDNVWFVMYAKRDISEGEFLMWKYNPSAGAGLSVRGKTYSFD